MMFDREDVALIFGVVVGFFMLVAMVAAAAGLFVAVFQFTSGGVI